MKGLTERQKEIADYIQQFIQHNRYSPSYREIGQHFGFASLGSVHKHIEVLKRKGMLLNEKRTSRSLAFTNQLSPQLTCQTGADIPFIGNIAIGMPIQTFPQAQQITVPKIFVNRPEKTYALRAQGDSLQEEMMIDGDILLIEVRPEAFPGETVLALINERDTIIKKYYVEGDYVHLTSAHAHHHPIILRAEDVQIQGVIIGLLRSFAGVAMP